MLIRKRGHEQNRIDCGDATMESGGIADPLVTEKAKQDTDTVKPDAAWRVPNAGLGAKSTFRPTIELATALHAAKAELAAEMETNLKQLKAVLKETGRIAEEMEAVMKEAKGEEQKTADEDKHKDADSESQYDCDAEQEASDSTDPVSETATRQSPPKWEPPAETARP